MPYSQRDIVLVPFPFSDLTNEKKRPAMVLSNNSYNQLYEDVLVCAITSNLNHEDDYSILISSADLDQGELPKPSLIKVHKLFTIKQDKIIRKFSSLNKNTFRNAKELLKNLLDDSNDFNVIERASM